MPFLRVPDLIIVFNVVSYISTLSWERGLSKTPQKQKLLQEQRGLLARSIEYLFDRIEGQSEQKEAGRSPKP